MIRLRSLINGQVCEIPPNQAVEITDLQGNIAILLMQDPQQNAVHLVTAQEDPETARNYAAMNGVSFSRVVAPDMDALQRQTAPAPTLFAS